MAVKLFKSGSFLFKTSYARESDCEKLNSSTPTAHLAKSLYF